MLSHSFSGNRESWPIVSEGDCTLDLCLEWDSYDSGYCKTNRFLSALINGRPAEGSICHKRTYAMNDSFKLNRSLRAVQYSVALTIEASLSYSFTLQCKARSEQANTPCIKIYSIVERLQLDGNLASDVSTRCSGRPRRINGIVVGTIESDRSTCTYCYSEPIHV